MQLHRLPLFLCCVLIVIISGCKHKRETIENRIIVTKTQLSLPTDYDIVAFDTYSEQDIFAIGHDGYFIQLFKSSNGGQTWTMLTDPIDYSSGYIQNVQSAVYMTANNLAFVANDRLYRSYDGGASWYMAEISWLPMITSFATKWNDKLLVFENHGTGDNNIYTSSYSSNTYTTIGQMSSHFMYFDKSHLNGDVVTLMSYDNDFYYDQMYAYDLSTQSEFTVPVFGTAYNRPIDAIHFSGKGTFFVRGSGLLTFEPGNSGAEPWYYNYHEEAYTSGETMGDYLIAVGSKTISTNYSGQWQEALNVDGTGQQDTLFMVKKASSSQFFVSGKHGLFFKGTFQ